MRLVLTGGGTGGHVVPNLAVIEELKKEGESEILYIGSKDGMEKKMQAMYEYECRDDLDTKVVDKTYLFYPVIATGVSIFYTSVDVYSKKLIYMYQTI